MQPIGDSLVGFTAATDFGSANIWDNCFLSGGLSAVWSTSSTAINLPDSTTGFASVLLTGCRVELSGIGFHRGRQRGQGAVSQTPPSNARNVMEGLKLSAALNSQEPALVQDQDR